LRLAQLGGGSRAPIAARTATGFVSTSATENGSTLIPSMAAILGDAPRSTACWRPRKWPRPSSSPTELLAF